MGNPKKQSRFICLKCRRENCIATGIQRKSQREKGHIKDLFCLVCNTETKNIEIRYCDNYLDIMRKVPGLHKKYYGEKQNVCTI